MTNIFAASFDAIAVLAPGADRATVDRLIGQTTVLDLGAKAAIALQTLSDHEMAAIGEAYGRATDAVDAALNAIIRRQYDLIAAVPEERESKPGLAPMSSPALLPSFIQSGGEEVTHIARELGDYVDAHRNGEVVGTVGAYSVRIEGDDLVVDGIGRWPLASIEAASCREGIAFLLDDGTLYELLQCTTPVLKDWQWPKP